MIPLKLNQKTLAELMDENPAVRALLMGRKPPKLLRSHDYKIVDGHLVKLKMNL